jgi:hypothetical protein
MKLLLEITINSVLNRVSNKQHNLTNEWKKRIISIDPISRGISSTHGGFARLGFGGVEFMPILFEDDWPPPIECPFTVKTTSDTEENASTLFTGTAHRSSYTFDSVQYEFYRDEYSTIIPDGTAFTTDSDTLYSVFNWACDAARLDLTFDGRLAETTSPDVYYQTSGDQLLVDFLDALAQAYCHVSYIDIESGTLYLIDVNSDNGSRTVSRWEERPTYVTEAPIAIAKTTNYYQESDYAYGTEISLTEFDNSKTVVETYLTKILTTHHKERCEMVLPFDSIPPEIGEKVSWTDSKLATETNGYIRVRNISYDFNRDRVATFGEGEMTI